MLKLIPILNWHENINFIGFFVEKEGFYRKFLSHIVIENYKNNVSWLQCLKIQTENKAVFLILSSVLVAETCFS